MSVRARLSPALVAALAALAASAAAAGELRPFNQPELCLDSSDVIRPGVNRISLATCTSGQTQNFRKGREHTIYVGSLCLQAVAVSGTVTVVAAPCHGRDGQRWVMTRDGRLSSGDRLCLTAEGEGRAARLLMTKCVEPPADQTAQKWAIYGKF